MSGIGGGWSSMWRRGAALLGMIDDGDGLRWWSDAVWRNWW
jgi:hypothetical protein